MRRRALTAARSERGQASVELVALLPLVFVVVAAVFCFLAAGQARATAASAAQAAAMALIQGGDPATAARRSAGRSHVAVRVRGTHVTVNVRPALPIHSLSRLLSAHATAYAGRSAWRGAPAAARRGGDGEGSKPASRHLLATTWGPNR